MIVVLVLITNCQVSLNAKSGPLTSQTRIKRHRKSEHARAPTEMSGCLGKARVPGCVVHAKRFSRSRVAVFKAQ